jgi:hypothetical protein
VPANFLITEESPRQHPDARGSGVAVGDDAVAQIAPCGQGNRKPAEPSGQAGQGHQPQGVGVTEGVDLLDPSERAHVDEPVCGWCRVAERPQHEGDTQHGCAH